jgi:hypothetical protein
MAGGEGPSLQLKLTNRPAMQLELYQVITIIIDMASNNYKPSSNNDTT